MRTFHQPLIRRQKYPRPLANYRSLSSRRALFGGMYTYIVIHERGVYIKGLCSFEAPPPHSDADRLKSDENSCFNTIKLKKFFKNKFWTPQVIFYDPPLPSWLQHCSFFSNQYVKCRFSGVFFYYYIGLIYFQITIHFL